MKNRKKYITQFTLSLSGSLIFTLLKHFEFIPHSVRVPTYYSYENFGDFLISFLGVWAILGFSIVIMNKYDSKKTNVICPSCEYSEEIFKKDIKTKQCPKCDTPMVPLEGFYDKDKN